MGMMWLGALIAMVVGWFVGDWIAALVFPNDDVSAFMLSCILSIVLGVFIMLGFRIRALKSGKYQKAKWGVRRR